MNGSSLNRSVGQLIHVVSQALEHNEREAVLGDLADCGTPALRALADISGLVLRRQLALWVDWKPWGSLGGRRGSRWNNFERSSIPV